MWNKKKLAIIAGLLSVTLTASAIVMQGESSPGIYPNIATNESGHIILAADNFEGMATAAKQDSLIGTVSAKMDTLLGRTPALLDGRVPVSGAVTISGTPQVAISGNVPVIVSNPLSVAIAQYVYRNISTNGTVVVKTTPGTLRRIVFNTPGVTSNIVVYDGLNASAPKIATINSALGQQSLTYELQFNTGLTIVAAGLTAADMTVVYQ